MNNTKWKKVSELKNGAVIAVFDGAEVEFEEIASITPIARERVYDIEIENAHNFVGNNMVAHNTAVFGNLNVREGAGFAEVFSSAEILKPEVGDIVSVTSQGFIKKAEISEPILGVVSANAGIMIGKASATSSPVAFAGKTSINISNENGQIAAGDKIILGSIPGIGAKATTSAMVVGIALEGTDFSTATTTIIAPNSVEAKIQKIMVFVNLGYSQIDTSLLTPTFQSGQANEGTLGGGFIIDQQTGKMTASYSINMDGKDLENVRSILSRSGLWSIGDDGRLFVQSIETEKLEVRSEITLGSANKRIGITIYDEKTGEPYCLKVSDGATITISGVCGSEGQGSSDQGQGTSTTPATDTTPPTIDLGTSTGGEEVASTTASIDQ